MHVVEIKPLPYYSALSFDQLIDPDHLNHRSLYYWIGYHYRLLYPTVHGTTSPTLICERKGTRAVANGISHISCKRFITRDVPATAKNVA